MKILQTINQDSMMHVKFKYGQAIFDYYSNHDDLKKVEDYFFSKTKEAFFDYKIYHVYNETLYKNIEEILRAKKYYIIIPHVINSYKVYRLGKYKIFISREQKFLIIQNDYTFYLIEYPDYNNKTSFLMYLCRDILRIHYENMGGFIFHSAAAIKGGKGIFIIGAGGAGKSTLTFNLMTLLNFKFVSNDRTFITNTNKLISFPMKIAIGKGTIQNNNLLYNCIKNSKKLKCDYSKCVEDHDKIAFVPIELSYSFDMSYHFKENNFKIIIFPNFNQNINSIERVPLKSARKILIEACCSINDPVWLKSVFRLHKKTKKERCIDALNKIDEILNTKLFYRLNYTKNLDSKKLCNLLKQLGFYEKS